MHFTVSSANTVVVPPTSTPDSLLAMWSTHLRADTVLVGDSFFGSQATAQRLARKGRPFSTMVRKDTAGVQRGGDNIEAGQMVMGTVDGHKYALQVYKQPKTGGTPPQLVPILSNVWYAARGPLHHTGQEIHLLVAPYRQVARQVDSANQMALQMRLLGRQMSCLQAVRGFLLPYAAANAFAACRTLERCRGTDSMWEWQWALLHRRYCTDAQPRRTIHVPVGGAKRRACADCGKGRTHYVCSGCPDTPFYEQSKTQFKHIVVPRCKAAMNWPSTSTIPRSLPTVPPWMHRCNKSRQLPLGLRPIEISSTHC